ncbi:MAG: hypothetical protein M1828_001940 [Chrysothrix sp. TS-e1954]|nr:MAG: hypothetical protein M1828_001940 [Chrysothrix sp. TS-e1954]
MADDREHLQAINPIVAESVAHNAKTLNTLRSLTSPLLGICAGALRLESFAGFGFFIFGTLLSSLFVWLGPCDRESSRFYGAGDTGTSQVEVDSRRGEKNNMASLREVAMGGVGLEGFMGFVMAWTLIYNLVGT